jgi:hypothetical protein
MTTYVPQDVLEDAVAAGFIVKDNLAIYSPVSAEFSIEAEILRLLELRAQRQQGAEPVAEHVVRSKFGTMCMFESTAVKKGDKVYTGTPPQANALVAAAYRDAAEIANQFEATCASKKGLSPLAAETARLIKEEILAAIPADAEAALREVCMKVAEKAIARGITEPYTVDALAIVNSVLGEGGK